MPAPKSRTVSPCRKWVATPTTLKDFVSPWLMSAIVLFGAGQAATNGLQSVLIPIALTEAMLGVTEKPSPDSTSAPLPVIIETERPPTLVVGETAIFAVAVVG